MLQQADVRVLFSNLGKDTQQYVQSLARDRASNTQQPNRIRRIWREKAGQL